MKHVHTYTHEHIHTHTDSICLCICEIHHRRNTDRSLSNMFHVVVRRLLTLEEDQPEKETVDIKGQVVYHPRPKPLVLHPTKQS